MHSADTEQVSAADVAALPDFSSSLPLEYRERFQRWRQGKLRGAKGDCAPPIKPIKQPTPLDPWSEMSPCPPRRRETQKSPLIRKSDITGDELAKPPFHPPTLGPTPSDPWDEDSKPRSQSQRLPTCEQRQRLAVRKPLCGGTAIPEVLLTTRGPRAEWRVLKEALQAAFRNTQAVTPDHPAAAILAEANHARLCAELRGLGRWEPGCYTRTTLHQSDGFVALLLCWSPGVMSPVVRSAPNE